MNENITITPAAINQIKLQLQKRGTPNAFLRLGVKGGSCLGFSYVFQFESNSKEKDIVFTIDGVTVLIDNKSIIYLNGINLDWEQSLLKQGFVFNNPHEKKTCGCGKSFST